MVSTYLNMTLRMNSKAGQVFCDLTVQVMPLYSHIWHFCIFFVIYVVKLYQKVYNVVN